MAETKFTPGPWVQADAFGASEHGTAVQEARPDGRLIASCTGYFGRDGAQANARLIAAAPEMFEALQAAMAFIDSHVADPDITQEMADNWARLRAADPHAALSKALGNGGE